VVVGSEEMMNERLNSSSESCSSALRYIACGSLQSSVKYSGI